MRDSDFGKPAPPTLASQPFIFLHNYPRHFPLRLISIGSPGCRLSYLVRARGTNRPQSCGVRGAPNGVNCLVGSGIRSPIPIGVLTVRRTIPIGVLDERTIQSVGETPSRWPA